MKFITLGRKRRDVSLPTTSKQLTGAATTARSALKALTGPMLVPVNLQKEVATTIRE